jgi:pantoate kinase
MISSSGIVHTSNSGTVGVGVVVSNGVEVGLLMGEGEGEGICGKDGFGSKTGRERFVQLGSMIDADEIS